MQETQERVLRVRPEALQELANLRGALMARVRRGLYAPADVWNAYNDALKQTLQNPASFVLDDREMMGVRCRDCGHTSSVPKEVDFWDCSGCHRKGRHAFIDMVKPNGEYVLNDDALTFEETDTSHIRAKALEEGATLQEADEEAARAAR